MQGMLVAKYGGSSIASKNDIENIKKITKDNPLRRIIVVSAPGKRYSEDIKVTDLLIDLAKTKNKSTANKIVERYKQIWPGTNSDELRKNLRKRMRQQGLNSDAYLDSLKAFGEESSAKALAKAMNAEYVDPKDFLVLSSDFGNAKVLPESYDKIRKLSDRKRILVLPGFYGYTKDGRIATMNRGGSDLTGAVVAAGLCASLYENFTDVNGIFAADPHIIRNPKKIKELTYHEMRDLAYLGSKLHPESIIPVANKNIPIHIRSVADYPKDGTHVVSERIVDPKHPIVGIAYQPGFCSFDICQLGLHERVGVLRNIAEVFEKNKLSIEYIPSAIDDISVIVRNRQFDGKKIIDIMNEINKSVGDGTKVTLEEKIGCLVVAGKGLRGQRGISAEIQGKLARAGVNIEFISQGSQERCIIYGISEQDGPNALNALYDEYIR